MRLTSTTIRRKLFFLPALALSLLSLCCICYKASAEGAKKRKHIHNKPVDQLFKGPASGVNITWTSCTAGTVFSSSPAGLASYTFGPSDCDGNGFTAISEATGTSVNSQARVLIGLNNGNNRLRFDRSALSGTPATFTKGHFKSTAGDRFKLTNLTVIPINNTSQTLTVTAYNGGVAVTGSLLIINYVAGTAPAHPTILTTTDFGTHYDNIDEIQLTSSLGVGILIDNIQTAAAVLLPLRLLDFTGRQEGNSVLLNWSTGSEENTSYFEVQRSVNNSAYAPLAKIAAAGNSNITVYYDYIDTLNLIANASGTTSTGTVYQYRLKMADLDSRFTFSPVVAIIAPPARSTLTIGPNPFSQQITVLFGSPEQDNAVFMITDQRGRKVSTWTLPIQKGNNTITLSGLGQLEKGIYFLSMTARGQTRTVKLMKNN